MRERHAAMLDHILQKRDISVAQRNRRELLVEIVKTLHSIRPRSQSVPDQTQVDEVLLIEQRPVMHELRRNIAFPWQDQFVPDQDLPQ